MKEAIGMARLIRERGHFVHPNAGRQFLTVNQQFANEAAFTQTVFAYQEGNTSLSIFKIPQRLRQFIVFFLSTNKWGLQ